jgi:hypothetical protein
MLVILFYIYVIFLEVQIGSYHGALSSMEDVQAENITTAVGSEKSMRAQI